MSGPRDRDRHDGAYDDEEDRPRRRPRAGGDSGNATVKIVAIVGAVVLGVVVVCGGLAAVVAYALSQAATSVSHAMTNVSKSMEELAKEAGRWQEAQQAAEAFLRDLRKNDFDRAYQATSKAYRERTSRKALEEYVAQKPIIRSLNATLTPQNPTLGGKRFTFKYSEPKAGGFVTLRVVVVEEDGGWKIDDLEAD